MPTPCLASCATGCYESERTSPPRKTPQVAVFADHIEQDADREFVNDFKATLEEFGKCTIQDLKDMRLLHESCATLNKNLLADLKTVLESIHLQFEGLGSLLKQQESTTRSLLAHMECAPCAYVCAEPAKPKLQEAVRCEEAIDHHVTKGEVVTGALKSAGSPKESKARQTEAHRSHRQTEAQLRQTEAHMRQTEMHVDVTRSTSSRYPSSYPGAVRDNAEDARKRPANEEDAKKRPAKAYTKAMDQPAPAVSRAGEMGPENSGEDKKNLKRAGLFGTMQAQKDHLDQPEYDVAQFYYETGFCQQLARSDYFSNLTLAVISANAVYIGVDADNNTAETLAEAHIGFQIFENAFAVYFALEWLIRLGAFRRKLDCLKDMWFKFDTVLVLMMVGETWVMSAIAGANPNIPLGFIKMLRLLRLARMARLMRAFPELVAMMKGVKVASRAVGSAWMMLLCNVYIFAIIMHMLVEGSSLENSLFLVMWDLLMDGTFLDSIGLYTRKLINEQLYLGVFVFMIFTLLSAMTVMNMLIGVLCEVVSAVAHHEKENNAIQLVKSTLLVMLRNVDDDGNGLISKDEIQHVVDDPDAELVFADLDLDVSIFIEHLEMLYETQPVIPMSDIIDLILVMRGDRQPSMKDLLKEQSFTFWKLSAELKKQLTQAFRA